MTTLASTIASALSSALSSDSSGLVAGLLHQSTSAQGLDFTKKTMTTTWFASNQATGITLEAQGWTIIPG